MNSYPQQDVILKYNNTGINRYPVTFEYDDEAQVVVRVFEPLTNSYTGVLTKGTDYVFDGPTNIVFLVPVPDKFTIFRSTDISQSYGTKRFSQFAQGNAIRASDLNGNLELLRQAIQETQSGESDNSGNIADLENKLDQEIIDRTEGDQNLQDQIDDIESDVNNIQSGKVNSVTATAPVVSSGGLDPIISMPQASSTEDGYMSKEDKEKLDTIGNAGYFEVTDYPELKALIPLDADNGLKLPDETSASTYEEEGAVRYNTGTERIEVYTDPTWEGVAGGAEIQTTPPANASPGDLWWDSEEGRGYVYYDDGDSKQWVESNPSWNGSIPDDAINGDKLADGSITPPKLSTGGPSWDASGNLDVSGGATFAGNIDVGNVQILPGGIRVTRTDDNFVALASSGDLAFFTKENPSSTNLTSQIKYDGSAEFAGRVNVGYPTPAPEDTIALAAINKSSGDAYPTLFLRNYDDAGRLLEGRNGSGATTVNIQADGSADFDGNINIANYDVSKDANGISLKSAGQVEVQCDSLQVNTFRLFRGTRNTTEVFNVKADGSAEFKGALECYGKNGTYSKVAISNPGNVVTLFGYSAANVATFSINAENGSASFPGGSTFSNAFITLEPDNDDNYTVTTEEYTETESYTGPLGNTLEREVAKTRDIRTYTGPTLDVKERLLNLISRLDALEADEIIDDSNSSALLQLVHNLSARLDLRDQQIADLTTRIQTLELN